MGVAHSTFPRVWTSSRANYNEGTTKPQKEIEDIWFICFTLTFLQPNYALYTCKYIDASYQFALKE